MLITAIIAFFILLLTNKYTKLKKPVVFILSLSYLLLILILTLQPIFISSYKLTVDEVKLSGNIKPFSLIIPQWRNVLSGQRGAFRQFFGNIIMFMPVGILMPLIFKRTKRFFWMLLGGFLFALSIETLQLVLCFAGMCLRSFDVDDLILNTFGAMLGYIVYLIAFHKKYKKTTS